jgi:predicted nucleic acid-binding protein
LRAALLDAGPVIGLLSRYDAHHHRTVTALQASAAEGRRLCTTWEVVGEAYTFVRLKARRPRSAEHAREVLRWAWESGVVVLGSTEEDHQRSTELLEQYLALDLSYVDALLLAIAERHRVEQVVTVDAAHFRAVRLVHDPEITPV